MTNRVSDANDALWRLVQSTLIEWTPVRNPTGTQAPKAGQANQPTKYADLVDDAQPEVLMVMCGPVYDLKLTSNVTVALVGGQEPDRRAAAWAAVEILKAAILADRTLGGVVEWTQVEAAQDAGADRLPWMAGGLRLPVSMLFIAPSEAG